MEKQIDFSALDQEEKIDILPPNNTIIFKLLETLTPVTAAKVLEIGFENTQHLPFLFQKTNAISYYGSTALQEVVDEALASQEIKNGSASFIKTAEDGMLAFAGAFFDCCFTVNTIYFWSDPIKQLKDIYRVLKPGGKLDLAIVEKNFGVHLPWTQSDFTFYQVKEITDFFLKSGFTHIEIKEMTEEITNKAGTEITRPFVTISGTK